MENNSIPQQNEGTEHVHLLDERFDSSKFLIVGIGASAGGIQALQEFFAEVSADSNMAYVIILHLSPDHDSRLAQVLQSTAKIPVRQVKERVRLEPNHAYVVPPNQHLTMERDYINVSPNTLMEERRAPVDIFFRTLADEQGPRSVIVILSGTGANGSMGLKRIKERGGATFVQNPREAEFNEMPRNAIATEMVDEVLPVAYIPAKIIAYRNNLSIIRIPDDIKASSTDQQAQLREIFTQLRVRTGHDFSNYKRPTLMRRIERRINIRSRPDLASYVTYLQQHPDETNALLKDLLISVTNFFRDKKAFDVLEQEIIPLLFKGKTAENRVRIWIAGCATGEEAYSIAMICAERLTALDAPAVQIFATDIDEASIAHAREGLYSINDAADVSPERLRRFFNREGDGYRIRREIRETIMFACHNFLKDPPFSHLDLVSCRNVLIYLNQIAQGRVSETFHFALNPGGFLFLGSSESVDGSSDLYGVYNRDQHIFQSRAHRAGNYPIPESIPTFHMAEKPKANQVSREPENQLLERRSFGDLHQQLLEQYAPPSLVINEEYTIVHLTERAGRYLQIGGGELSQNLLKLIRPEIRLELRSALYQCMQRRSIIETRRLQLIIDEKTETISIRVQPVLHPDDAARGFILVVFEPENGEEKEEEVLPAADEPLAKQFEEEAIRLKTQLRTTSEQYEFQAEELKASNEELQAMNEELRSAAEELETSKEELQSINEELRTVNQELKVKIEETSIAGNNLQNLINSSDIGTIFLDRSFRVVLFTPAARNIFNLIAADHGRPLSDITSRLEHAELLADAETVLQKLSVVEREISSREGKIYLMRITPYRTDEDRIKGVVISFIDITESRIAEKALRAVNERMRLIVESAKDYAIFTLDLQRHVNSWNKASEAVFGYTEEEITGRPADILFVPEDQANGAPAYETEKAQKEGRAENERWHNRKNGERFYGSGVVTPLHDSEGNMIGFVKIMRDLTRQKQAEEALRESEERLRITMESVTDYAIITTDATGIIQGWNTGAERIFGYTAAEVTGRPASIVLLPADITGEILQKEMQTAREQGYASDERWHRHKDGSLIFMSGVVRPILSTGLTGFVKVARNVTEQRQAEERIRISEERYRVALQSSEMAAWDWNIPDRKIVWNEQYYKLIGLAGDEREDGNEHLIKFVYPNDKTRIGRALVTAIKTGGILHEEFRIVRAGNQGQRWMSLYGRAVAHKGTRATRLMGVMYDITERKQLEQQKEEFIGIASHELKTPVTSIKAYGELLEEMFEEVSHPESMDLMRKLNTQVNRLNNLITDLLDTTKIAEGQLLLNWERFDLTELTAERVEELSRLWQKHRLVFRPAGRVMISADKERIRQVLNNLISNAVKYSPGAEEVQIFCELLADEVKIGIADRGIGIPKELEEKVFDRFFRVQQSQVSTFPGMGLGLYITAGIIHRHGGAIWATGQEGGGTIFYFTLPYKAND